MPAACFLCDGCHHVTVSTRPPVSPPAAVVRLAVVGLAVALAACSGDDGAADIGPDVVTVATGAPESAAVTDETYLVSGEGGVVLVDDAESRVLYPEVASAAAPDGAAGLVFQQVSGDRIEFDPAETAIWWVPAGGSEADLLIEPPLDAALELIEARTFDGELSVFYVRLEGELERLGTLHRFDVATGEASDLGPVEGIELGATHSVGADTLVASYIADPDCDTRFLDLQGNEKELTGLPAAFAAPGVCGEVPFRTAVSADDRHLAYAEVVRNDEGAITHTDAVVVDLTTSEEIARVNIRPEGVSWNIEDLDIGPDALIVNRWSITDDLINPLIVGLDADDPMIVEAPAPGRAAWVDAPIEIDPPITVP